MSGIIYAISDPHFGHRNMALKRGFSGVEEHDEHIVQEWNKVVTKRDTVHLLGDITMEKKNYEILKRLNGFIKVTLGNHDKPGHVREMLNYVNDVAGIRKVCNYWLTHCPIHPRELYRAEANVHGHVHENSITYEFAPDERYINVSMEAVDYKPFKLN